MLSKAAGALHKFTRSKNSRKWSGNSGRLPTMSCATRGLIQATRMCLRSLTDSTKIARCVRQIEQWDRAAGGWAKIDENDPTTAGNRRIETAEQLQAELRDEKFGDINLFIALADEDFKCVWWHKGQADPSILRAYVKGNKARAMPLAP